MNADRAEFKEFMKKSSEIMADVRVHISKVEDHMKRTEDDIRELQGNVRELQGNISNLSPSSVSHGSPMKLSDEGEKMSEELSAAEWAKKTAAILMERAKGLSAFKIQELCYNYVMKEFKPDTELEAQIEECAYQHGMSKFGVLYVLVIELRDVLLEATK